MLSMALQIALIILLMASIIMSMIKKIKNTKISHDLPDFNMNLEQLIQSYVQQNELINDLHQNLSQLIDTQKKNEIKKGEANRTLRRRIQDQNKAYSSLLNEYNKRTTSIINVRDMAEKLFREIQQTHRVLEDTGIPKTKILKSIKDSFKGKLPSELYAATVNQMKLKQRIMPDDAA